MAVIKINRRDKLGSRASQRLRENNLIPGIIYGHGRENIPVSLPAHDIELAIQHGEHLIEGELDGKKENFLIKDMQYDYLGHQLIHVDLTRVSLHERVEVTVPIVLRGTPVGVESEGGVMSQHLTELDIQCLVTNIPEELRVSVSDMHVNDVLRVADLQLPEGVTTSEDPETVIASITVVEEEVEAPAAPAEAAGEPEVISEKTTEEPDQDQQEQTKDK